MRYSDIRSHLHSGDLLAWSHRGWGSRYDVEVMAVRVFTMSEYCHVGVAYRINGRVTVVEAVGSGVRIFPLSRLVPFYHLSMQLAWNEAAEAFAWSTLGQAYSKWQAVAAHLGLLHAGADTTWQCAEHAQALLALLGCLLRCKPTPTELVAAAQRRPHAVLRLVEADA